jgi:hypothetical protein
MNPIVDLEKLKTICTPHSLGNGYTLWLHPAGKSVRDVVRPNALNRTVRVPSFKAGRNVHVEGERNEPLAVKKFDIDIDVLDVVEQPEVLEVPGPKGRSLHIIPDFLLRRVNGFPRIEVKSAMTLITHPSLAESLRWKKAAYLACGLDYRIIVPNTRDKPVYWRNVELVAAKRFHKRHPEDMDRIRLHLAERAASTLGACAALVRHDAGDPLDTVLAMQPRRLLSLDLSRPLGTRTKVRFVLS